ncbi:MAG: sigma-70 family RNA polymerase sigma factor [Rhizobiales bacterium]|nr:sigma-70 family RNA polymerase sigma factor [Hyphomicrobiales bacterium]
MDNGRHPRQVPTDADLVAQVAGGEVAAFGLLYDRYHRPVYVLAAHVLGPDDAEEVLQEVFLLLWRKADQFDQERGSFGAWFMTIARHRVLEEASTRTRRRPDGVEEIERILARTPDPTAGVEEEVCRRERGHAARHAVANLPTEQRQVIVLAYFGGLSQTAIARDLHLPLGTVKKRTRLAFQKLRATLAEHALPTASHQTDRPNSAAPAREKAGTTDGL